jgi:hypothetical protein
LREAQLLLEDMLDHPHRNLVPAMMSLLRCLALLKECWSTCLLSLSFMMALISLWLQGRLLKANVGVDGIRLFKTATCFLTVAGWRPNHAAISAVEIPSCSLNII